MQKRLLIDLAIVPEEGMAIAGQLDPGFFEIDSDEARPAGPVDYDLYVSLFGTELLLRGEVRVPFEFECVRTLKKFVQTLEMSDFAISMKVEDGAKADATEALREEVLLIFPVYPKCEDADEAMDCEIDSRYLAVDKPSESVVDPFPPTESEDVWEALDGFQATDENRE